MMAEKQKDKPQEKTDRELLEEINGKLDLLLAVFGFDKKQHMSPREIEAEAQETVRRFRDRQAKKKMFKEQGGK